MIELFGMVVPPANAGNAAKHNAAENTKVRVFMKTSWLTLQNQRVRLAGVEGCSKSLTSPGSSGLKTTVVSGFSGVQYLVLNIVQTRRWRSLIKVSARLRGSGAFFLHIE
jgi:hypothetical protein